MIDIVPGDLKYGPNDGITLLEKYYYNMLCAYRKFFISDLLHFEQQHSLDF